MTQFCRFLPEFGWTPFVMTRYYGHEATPELLAEKVHPDVQVAFLDRPQKAKSQERAKNRHIGLKKLIGGMAGLWCIPDPSIIPWRSFRGQVLEAVKRHQPDVILTTSPPHSNHDIGIWLTKHTGIPWVADFRDPFLIDETWQPHGWARLRWSAYNQFERQIYENAQLILHAIPVHGRWASRRYTFARNRIRILTNGYPPELVDGTIQANRTPAGRKSVRVVGFAGDAEMLNLANAVAILVAEGHDVELRLVGKPPATLEAMHRLLDDRLVITGPLPHPDALSQIAGADVLVNYLSPQRSRAKLLSSKLFEYLGAGKPTIAINPTFPDKCLLREVGHGWVLNMPTAQTLADMLNEALNSPARATSLSSQKYNRRALTKQLAQDLDLIIQ